MNEPVVQNMDMLIKGVGWRAVLAKRRSKNTIPMSDDSGFMRPVRPALFHRWVAAGAITERIPNAVLVTGLFRPFGF